MTLNPGSRGRMQIEAIALRLPSPLAAGGLHRSAFTPFPSPLKRTKNMDRRTVVGNLSCGIALLAVGLLTTGVGAADKEVTLKGTILCAKCALKEKGIKKCTTAIQVEEAGKTVTYYLLDKGNKEDYHEAVCGGDKKEGTVTGVVSEKDGKKYITPKKVVYAEKSAAKGKGCCGKCGCCCKGG